MKRIVITVLMCILLFILDNTLVPFFSIKGFYPSLLFIFVIFYSIINDTLEAMWIGILSGALQDLYFYNGFFVNTFTNMLICILAAKVGNSILKEKLIIPVTTSFILSFLKGVVIFVILYLVKTYTNFQYIIFNSLYTMVVSFIMYKWIYKFLQKDYMQKKWKF